MAGRRRRPFADAPEPYEAGEVVGVVLDPLGQDRASVQLCRQPGAERRPRLAGVADEPTASAVDVAATRSASGSCSRRKRAHCAVACGWDSTRRTSDSWTPGPAIRW